MKNEIRLIDANALIDSLNNMASADVIISRRAIVDCTLHELMPKVIDDEPTIKAVTQDQYEQTTEQLIKELSENTNPAVAPLTLASMMTIALVLGNLELRLFGEDSDNNVKT